MSIDFTLSPELEAIRLRVREFMDEVVRPTEQKIGDPEELERAEYIKLLFGMRDKAKAEGLWLPHMPEECGGMGLGHVELAMVQAEAAKTGYGPFVLNCQAPDEGNMHTLLHWATPEQKEKYLKPLCDGMAMSCFAMTEPEVAGSDPTLIQTRAVRDGDDWVINGHKWFISNARRARFAILIARTEDEPGDPAGREHRLHRRPPVRRLDARARGRDDARRHGHSEIRIENLRVPDENRLGPPGSGHMLGQYRLGPARLAHCMRWIAQAETALDMMVDRSTKRFAHGSLLSEKQGIQWMIADSTMELYQAKLMVLHAAYRIDKKLDFKSEVSMAKHFVANTLGRVIDRSIQVHGALGYSTDTPLAHMYQHARWARFADGADEVHQMRIAQRTIAAYQKEGSTRSATGDLPI